MINICFCSTLLLNIILKLPFLKIPLDRDYGIYGYHALFWLRGEKIPYIHIKENHPPGRWLLYTLLLKLFPVSRYIFHISNLFFLICTNIVLIIVTNYLFGTTIACVAGLSFAVLSSLPVYAWPHSSDEIEQLLCTLLAILLVLMAPSTSFIWFLGVGFATFIAILFKQSAYINTLPLVMIIMGLVHKINYISISTFIMGISLGYLAIYLFFKKQNIGIHHFRLVFALGRKVIGTYFRWLSYHKGKQKVKEFSSNTQQKTPAFPKKKEIPSKVKRPKIDPWQKALFFNYLKQSGFFIVLSLIALAKLLNIPNNGFLSLFFIIWLVIIMFSLFLNKHLMPYHFIPLLAPLSILSGYGIVISGAWITQQTHISITLITFALAVGLYLYMNKSMIKKAIWAWRKGCKGFIYTDSEADYKYYQLGEKIGKYLKQVTNEDDQIYVWGAEYEIYLWAERCSPTYSLFCPRPQISYSPNPYFNEKRAVQQLKAKPPKFIVATVFTDGFERFNTFLKQYYRIEQRIEKVITIYRRKTPKEISKLPLVSIVMLSYNTLDMTRKCINSIRDNTLYPHEIIFVDNGSRDGSKDFLRNLVKKHSNYHLIDNQRNRGFAGGNNQGMQKVKGDYILLLNNDVLVPGGWLKRMVACLESHDSIGLVGPVTNKSSGLQELKGLQDMDGLPYDDAEGLEAFAAYVGRENRKKYTPRSRLSAFALLMKRKVYEAIGELDEDYKIGNFEDDDFCLRAARAGFKIMVAGDVYIHHFSNVSFKRNKIDYDQLYLENYHIFQKKWPDVDVDEIILEDQRQLSKFDQMLNEGSRNLQSGNLQTAREKFAAVLKFNPVNLGTLYGLSLCFRNNGNYPQAIQLIKRILRVDPEHAPAYNLLGEISLENGNIKEAYRLFQRSLKVDPDCQAARENIRTIALKMNKVRPHIKESTI